MQLFYLTVQEGCWKCYLPKQKGGAEKGNTPLFQDSSTHNFWLYPVANTEAILPSLHSNSIFDGSLRGFPEDNISQPPTQVDVRMWLTSGQLTVSRNDTPTSCHLKGKKFDLPFPFLPFPLTGMWMWWQESSYMMRWRSSIENDKIIRWKGHRPPLALVAKSCPTLATPWTVACQAPLSRGFSRQEYWSGGVGCHFLLQGLAV